MTMLKPCHPGEILRDNLEAAELPVTEAASQLGCTRQALSRLLNGRSGVSPAMALALERVSWSNASFWVWLQAVFELTQERRRQVAWGRVGKLTSSVNSSFQKGDPSSAQPDGLRGLSGVQLRMDLV